MAYAEGRTFFDADSHVMELPDFLLDFADAALRDRLPPLSVSSGGLTGNSRSAASCTTGAIGRTSSRSRFSFRS